MYREMSQVVALVHKVKGTFRRNDLFVKYMDKIVNTAEAHTQECQPAAVELDDDVDLDFFDRQDLGVLNRRLRKVCVPFKHCVSTLRLGLLFQIFKTDQHCNRCYGKALFLCTYSSCVELAKLCRAWIATAFTR